MNPKAGEGGILGWGGKEVLPRAKITLLFPRLFKNSVSRF